MKKNHFPLFSIIIPTKNGGRFISDALNSLVTQKYPKLEVIVVDGASTDNTLEIVEKYKDCFSHFTIISKEDSGQSEAMNKGIKEASGSIIGFLNHDDWYSEGALFEAAVELSNSEIPTLLIGNCYVHRIESGEVSIQNPSLPGLEYFVSGFQNPPYNSTQYFYHKRIHQIIGLYPEDDHLTMDLWFYLECCASKKISSKYVNKNWGNFRYYSGTKTFENQDFHRKIYRAYRFKYFFRLTPIQLFKVYQLKISIWKKKFKKLLAKI